MKGKDDTGRRVVVNSVGGPSWPDNRSGKAVVKHYDELIARWTKEDRQYRTKRALENVGGVVVWGPATLRYEAMTKVGYDKHKRALKKRQFDTCPLWGVLLDGYGLVISFAEQELTFE